MLVKREFHNIECDCCGQLLDEETWWDDQDALTTTILPECGWIECEGGRHYCDECWTRDDDDNIVTKDGRKWDDYDHKEMLTDVQRYRLDYLKDLLDPNLTITQIRMEIIKAQLLCRSMVGTLYKNALLDEIERAFSLYYDRRESASESEKDAYDTFAEHSIFYHLLYEGFPNDGKDLNIY